MNVSNAFDAPWHELALKGDAKAVLTLAERTLRPLYLCCAEHAGGDRFTSEELAQRVMLRAVRSLHGYSAEQYDCDIFRWLSEIALDEVFEVLSSRPEQTTDNASWPTDQELYKQLLEADAACVPLNENCQSETYGPASHFVDQVEAEMCVAAIQMRGKGPSDDSSSRLKAKQISAVNVACPFCGHRGQLNQSLLGRDVRCSECGNAYATGSTVVPSEQAVATPADAVRQWYYKESGHEFGPFAAYELRDKISSEELSLHVPVRKGADGDWKEAVGSSELYGPDSHRPEDHQQGTNAGQSEQAGSQSATSAQLSVLPWPSPPKDEPAGSAAATPPVPSVLAPVKPPPVPPPSVLAPFKPLKKTRRKLPKKIGRFEILDWLGRGSFGDVYRAHDPVLDRDVALKVLRSSAAVNPDARAFFLQEPKAAAKLRHPNIVTVHDAGAEGELLYIAIDFIDGETLQDVLEQKQVDFEKVAKIIRSLADALNYAHQVGVVHRDVKPGNVMIDRDGHALLMDFGLARIEHSADKPDSKEHQLLGTPGYLAPEQADGSYRKVGPHSDQYGLGVVMYEMLCGKKPFSGPPRVLIFNTINVAPEPPRSQREEVPEDLDAICLKAISKRPEERYADCGELAEDLRRFLDNEETQVRPWPLPERIDRWRKREPWLASMTGIAISVVLAFILLAAVFAVSESRNAGRFEDQRDELEDQRDELEVQRDELKVQRDEKEEARRKAEAAELDAVWQQAEAVFDSGHRMCEQGKVGEGMIKMAESLQLAEDAVGRAKSLQLSDAAKYVDLATAIRFNLAAWYRELYSLPRMFVHKRIGATAVDKVTCVAISPDGKRAVTVGRSPSAKGAAIALWDLSDERANRKPAFALTDVIVQAVEFGPLEESATTLTLVTGGVVADGRGVITQWRISENGISFVRQSKPFDDLNSLFSVAVTADGKEVFVGGANRTSGIVKKLDAERWTVKKSIPCDKPVRCLALHDDKLAVGMGDREIVEGWVAVYDAVTLTQSWQRGPIECVHAVAFSPDGKRLVTGGGMAPALRGQMMLWDTRDGESKGARRHEGQVYAVAFSPDGSRILAGGQNRSASLWDRSLRLLGHPLWHLREVRSVAFHPSGWSFLTGSDDGTARLYDLATGIPARELGIQVTMLTCGTQIPGTNQFVFASAGLKKGMLTIRDLTASRVDRTMTLSAIPTAVTVHKNGRMLVGCVDGTVKFSETVGTTSKDLPTPHRKSLPVRAVAFSDDGRFAISGGEDGYFHLYDIDKGILLCERPHANLNDQAKVYAVAFDPHDDTKILIGGKDGYVRIWQWTSGTNDIKQIAELPDHGDTVLSIGFSADGEQMVTGYLGGARLWHRVGTTDWKKDDKVFESTTGIRQVAIDSSREIVVTGDTKGTVRLWHSKTKRMIGPALHSKDIQLVTALTLHSGRGELLLGRLDGSFYRWKLPLRMKEPEGHILKWTKKITGLKFVDPVERLSAEEWVKTADDLEKNHGVIQVETEIENERKKLRRQPVDPLPELFQESRIQPECNGLRPPDSTRVEDGRNPLPNRSVSDLRRPADPGALEYHPLSIDEIARYLPSDTAAVVGVDAQQAFSSTLFRRNILDFAATARDTKNKASEFLRDVLNKADIDLLTDVDTVLCALPNDYVHMTAEISSVPLPTIVVRGRFDREKVYTALGTDDTSPIVKLEDSRLAREVYSYSDEQLLMISGNRKRLEEVVGKLKRPPDSLALPASLTLPSKEEQKTIWMVVTPRMFDANLLAMYKNALASLTEDGSFSLDDLDSLVVHVALSEDAQMTLKLNLKDSKATAWKKMLKKLQGMGQLAPDATITSARDNMSVNLNLRISGGEWLKHGIEALLETSGPRPTRTARKRPNEKTAGKYQYLEIPAQYDIRMPPRIAELEAKAEEDRKNPTAEKTLTPAESMELSAAKRKIDEARGRRNAALKQVRQLLEAKTVDPSSRALAYWFEVIIFPEMTQLDNDTLSNLPKLRSDFLRAFTQRPRLSQAGHAYFVRTTLNKMKYIAENEFHPDVRYNAMLMIGQLNSREAVLSGRAKSPPVPYQPALSVLLDNFANDEQIEAVREAALLGILRHAELLGPDMAEEDRDKVIEVMRATLDAALGNRTPEEHASIQRRAVDVLGKLRHVGAGSKD